MVGAENTSNRQSDTIYIIRDLLEASHIKSPNIQNIDHMGIYIKKLMIYK